MRQFFARLFLFTGLLCFIFLGMLVYQRYRPNPLAFHGAVFTRELSSTSSTMPIGVKIESVEIDLPIYVSEINGTTWQTSEQGVSYLKSSPLPGEKGNAVLYGHNWPKLLGPLHNVHVGDRISVVYSDKRVITFTVAYITIVSPDQIKILESSDDSRLTVYTCTGFLDSKRLVLTAIKED